MKYSFTRSYVCFPSSLRHVFRGSLGFSGAHPGCLRAKPGLAPWTSRHIVAGPHSKTDNNSHLPPRANLEFLISLTCMCLDRGNKPERLETTCGLHAERPRDRTHCFLVVRRQCYDCILFHELDWSSSLSGGWIPDCTLFASKADWWFIVWQRTKSGEKDKNERKHNLLHLTGPLSSYCIHLEKCLSESFRWPVALAKNKVWRDSLTFW